MSLQTSFLSCSPGACSFGPRPWVPDSRVSPQPGPPPRSPPSPAHCTPASPSSPASVPASPHCHAGKPWNTPHPPPSGLPTSPRNTPVPFRPTVYSEGRPSQNAVAPGLSEQSGLCGLASTRLLEPPAVQVASLSLSSPALRPPPPRELREPGLGPGAHPLPGVHWTAVTPAEHPLPRPLGRSPAHTHCPPVVVPLWAAGATRAGRWVPAPSHPRSLRPRQCLSVWWVSFQQRLLTGRVEKGAAGTALALGCSGCPGTGCGRQDGACESAVPWPPSPGACGTRAARMCLARARCRLPAWCRAAGPISLPMESGEKGVPSATLGNGPQTGRGFCSKSAFCHTIDGPHFCPPRHGLAFCSR